MRIRPPSSKIQLPGFRSICTAPLLGSTAVTTAESHSPCVSDQYSITSPLRYSKAASLPADGVFTFGSIALSLGGLGGAPPPYAPPTPCGTSTSALRQPSSVF